MLTNDAPFHFQLLHNVIYTFCIYFFTVVHCSDVVLLAKPPFYASQREGKKKSFVVILLSCYYQIKSLYLIL